MEVIQIFSASSICYPGLPQGNFGAFMVPNDVKIEIVAPRGPQLVPGVPQRSSKFNSADNSGKNRENGLFWWSFRVTKAGANAHPRDDVRDGRGHLDSFEYIFAFAGTEKHCHVASLNDDGIFRPWEPTSGRERSCCL